MAEAGESPRRRPDPTTPDHLVDSPKRGASNISTSTSSFEAGVQHDPSLNRLAVNMFTKTELFLQGELDAVTGEYQLLTEMNKQTHKRYVEMYSAGREAWAALEDLNRKYIELEPYLRQLDDVDKGLALLEATVIKLDAYSKQLESRCRAATSR